MMIGHMSKTGNVSIPKKWREELGFRENSSLIIEREGDRLILEPMSPGPLKDAWKEIDEEIKRKGIKISRKEAINASIYD
ncbi:TPA: AbrB/MazE/SpoVT family DNA-binding domain-containing protein [Candidatus Woesearchaeota archaeon]|nr:AbrB/MazE/SpoVT family DNA-binding domain-containing protein [Candidatus Woesearchaeota archaeon]